MSGLTRFARNNLSQYLNVVCLVLVVIGFTAVNPNFISAFNLKNILTDIAPLLLVSGTLTFVLLLGCIDLSTGSVISCSCVIAGLYIGQLGTPVMIVLMALMGLAAGLLNGLVYTVLKVPTFVATLCTAAIWQCGALLISGGSPRGIPMNQWGMIAWSKWSPFGIPAMFIASISVLLVLYFIQSRLPVGRSILAVGANEKAARMMGVRITRAKIAAFALTGIGASLAGVFYAVKLRSSLPTIGNQLTLMAIASVVLGGTTLSGGIGSVLRTLIGVSLVIALQNGLNVVAVDAFWQEIVFGCLVIVAIVLNADKSGRDVIVK